MSLANPNNVVTEERLAEFYQSILPYLGGMPDVLANKFSRADLYSTDEKMIGRWVDGKPLYQKTVNTGALPNATTKTVAHGISNVDKIVNAHGYANNGNETLYFNHPYDAFVNVITNTSSINIRSKSNLSVYSESYVTIQYTKTTDSAIEIGSDTDYSTDEKIVGTWIDGKPVYQKVVDYGTIPAKTVTKNVDISDNLSIDTVVSLFGIATTDDKCIPLPFAHPDSNGVNSIFLRLNDKNTTTPKVQAYTGTNSYTSYTAKIIIQYTKTTD